MLLLTKLIIGLPGELGGIREVGILYPSPKGEELPTIQTTLSQMRYEKRIFYEALNPERYCSQSM